MLIEFSMHSLEKIGLLKSHGIAVSKELIENVVRNPDRIDTGYKGRLIAQNKFDDTHDDRIYIITVYPGRRSRYEKDQV